jgi:hypothetical protein
LINLEAIYRNVQRVIGNATGDAVLANALSCLPEAIEGAEALGLERAFYPEQVKFLAEQAAEPLLLRQVNIVHGVLAGLRARLQNVANIAQIMSILGPAAAAYFDFKWP